MTPPRLERALREAGAVLVRRKRHNVWRLPSGRMFVSAQSPSDRRAEHNALRDLRAALREPSRVR